MVAPWAVGLALLSWWLRAWRLFGYRDLGLDTAGWFVFVHQMQVLMIGGALGGRLGVADLVVAVPRHRVRPWCPFGYRDLAPVVPGWFVFVHQVQVLLTGDALRPVLASPSR